MRATVVNDVAAQEGGLVLMWRTGETAAVHTHTVKEAFFTL